MAIESPDQRKLVFTLHDFLDGFRGTMPWGPLNTDDYDRALGYLRELQAALAKAGHKIVRAK